VTARTALSIVGPPLVQMRGRSTRPGQRPPSTPSFVVYIALTQPPREGGMALFAAGDSIMLLRYLFGPLLFCLIAMVDAHTARAVPIRYQIYTFQLTQGYFGGDFIDTDGTLGALGSNNILGYRLPLQIGNTSTALGYDPPFSLIDIAGSGFLATSAGLFFDFDAPNAHAFFTYSSLTLTTGGLCFQAGGAGCSNNSHSVSFYMNAGPISADMHGPLQIGSFLSFPAPSPVVGAGLPGLLMAIAGFIGWRRSRRAYAIAA
jgi:hypothetical protein